MIQADENALICDLAETYNIFDYKELPPFKVAILSIGLRDNSRIKMAISKSKVDSQFLILASILDYLRMLVWLNSSQGAKGEGRPSSLVEKLVGKEEDHENLSFESAEDFERERERIILSIKERE